MKTMISDKNLFPDFDSYSSEGKFQPTTKRGYDMYEVVSALQKSIRRDMPEDAVYWGMELLNSGFVKYMWRRLLIICAEDIDDANVISAVKILNDNYFEVDKDRPHRIFITRAILLLCKANKNRNADHYQNLYDYDETKKQIPIYALDKHTKKGKAMGKNKLDFFVDEHKGLNPLVDDENDRLVYNRLIDKIKKEK